MMLDTLQTILQPIIVDLLLAVILATVAWLMRLLPARWRIEIEARHRQALHSALDTGVEYALAQIKGAARTTPIGQMDAVIGRTISYVRDSVPDAIRALGPDREQLERMARAKLQARLDEALGRDRLAEALKEAGAPV